MLNHQEDITDYATSPTFLQGIASPNYTELLKNDPEEMKKAMELVKILKSAPLAAAIAKAQTDVAA